MSCRVEKCRYPTTHTTKGHKCGTCKKYGHGQQECHNEKLKNKLLKYYDDKILYENQCKFGGCKYKKFHTTEGHNCSNCNNYLHAYSTCPLNQTVQVQQNDDIGYEIICPLCREKNNFTKNLIHGSNEDCVICFTNTLILFLFLLLNYTYD